jgi:chemotaxis methyl-accepting protein methylase
MIDRSVPPHDAEPTDGIGAVLSLLKHRLAADFSHYRRPMLERRITSRMHKLGVRSLPEYVRRLQSDEQEARHLLERITIKVSRFYRNADTFELLRHEVLPTLAEQHRGRPLRLWSAGCGRGEEAWSLAMLVDEAGLDATIVGTDLDEAALVSARAALYPVAAAVELPPSLAARYLEPVMGRRQPLLRVSDALRARVTYSRQNLLHLEPGFLGERFNLVTCRNVLIYFQRPAQMLAMAGLYGALEPGGYLCLGEAEWPVRGDYALATISTRARLFRRVADPAVESSR